MGQDEQTDGESDTAATKIYLAALEMDKYYTPILFIFGTFGNSLSLLVFCMNSKYRSQSASYYLSALAISDTGFLVNLLAVWLEGLGVNILTSGVMCPLVMYLGQVTCFMSVYLTAAFSIERYVAVHYPLSRPRICTRSKARKIIAAITITALVFFSYAWVIAEVIELPSDEKDYYDDPVRENLTPVNNLTITVGNFSQLLFGDGQIEKRESFSYDVSRGPAKPLAFQELNSEAKPKDDILVNLRNCSGIPEKWYKESISSMPKTIRTISETCSGLHLDGTILERFRNSQLPEHTRGSAREVSTLSGAAEYETMKNPTDEEFYYATGYLCTVPQRYFFISEIANYIDTVITLIVPFFLISFFNIRIAVCVWKLQKQRQTIVANTAVSYGEINQNQQHRLRCSQSSSMNPNRRNLSVQDALLRNTVRRHHHVTFEEEQETNFSFIPNANKRTSIALCPEGIDEFTNENRQASYNCQGDREICQTQDDGVLEGVSSGRQEMKYVSTLQTHTTVFGRRSGAIPVQLKVALKAECSVTRERRSGGDGGQLNTSSNSSEVRVTKTLLLVSTVFLVLNLPSHAIRCALFIQSLRGTSEGLEILHAAQPWTNILFNTNFAVNFLLYCVSGRNFRNSLRNIIWRKCSTTMSKPQYSWKAPRTSKSSNQDGISISNNLTKGKKLPTCRQSIKKHHATEIVELEERIVAMIHPNNQAESVNHASVQEL